jgi:hypothetical protein
MIWQKPFHAIVKYVYWGILSHFYGLTSTEVPQIESTEDRA